MNIPFYFNLLVFIYRMDNNALKKWTALVYGISRTHKNADVARTEVEFHTPDLANVIERKI